MKIGKCWKNVLAGYNPDAVKIKLRGLGNFEIVFPLLQVLESFSSFLCHFVTCIREHYE